MSEELFNAIMYVGVWEIGKRIGNWMMVQLIKKWE